MKTGIIFRMLICVGLLIFGQMICFGNRAKEYRFFETPLNRALQEISCDFGSTIIANPNLPGRVTGNITAASVEKVLQAILEPLGYWYTKVDDFYLVNGKDTPLEIFNNDSAVIHFGPMVPEQRAGLREYQKYMVYDENSGVVFIKAPTGIMGKILAKIRELMPERGPALVAYHFRIMDLTTNSDFKIGLQGIIRDEPMDDAIATITPGNMVFETVKNRLKVTGNLALNSGRNCYQGHPWLLATVGKPTRLASLLHYPGDEMGRDREFVLKLTPIHIDEAIGQVVSEIYLEYNRDQVGKLATTLRTTPDQYQLIAILRRRDRLPEHTLTQKESLKKERDFAVLMAAIPVDMANTASAGINKPFLGALLDGFGEFTENHDKVPGSNSELEFGFAGTGDQRWTPWFQFNTPLGPQADLNIRYHGPNDYALGLTGYWDESRETSFELLAGNQIGLGDKPLVMIGLGDIYQPFQFLTLSGKYYPVVYRLDAKEFLGSSLWEGGLRLGPPQLSLSVNFFGNPEPYKTDLSLEYQNKSFGFSLGVTQEYVSPNINFSVGLKLKL
jgi:hypothetical protein